MERLLDISWKVMIVLRCVQVVSGVRRVPARADGSATPHVEVVYLRIIVRTRGPPTK